MNEFYGMSFRLNEIFATLLTNPIIQLDSSGTAYLDNYVSASIIAISDRENPRRYDVMKHMR